MSVVERTASEPETEQPDQESWLCDGENSGADCPGKNVTHAAEGGFFTPFPQHCVETRERTQ